MIEVPRNPNYSRNYTGSSQHDPCVICGKDIKKPLVYVHLHEGGSHLVTEDEVAGLDSSGDMGFFPVGPECVKAHPEIKPYLSL